MKTAQIQNMFFVLMMILICGGISWLATMELRKENELRQKEIDHLKKQNAKELDSLNTQLAIKQDSLNIVLQLISVAHQESVEARERSQRTIRDLQRIIFITHTDSSRNAELTKLYPSFKP